MNLSKIIAQLSMKLNPNALLYGITRATIKVIS